MPTDPYAVLRALLRAEAARAKPKPKPEPAHEQSPKEQAR